MRTVALTAYPRSLTGRNGVKKLRAQGRVPAVVYGGGKPARNVEVPAKAIEDIIHHAHTENLLVDLSIAEDSQPKRLAVLREVQHHPLTGRILHVDFHEIREDQRITVTVPVEPVGEAAGVKAGGVLETVLFHLKIEGLPRDLPEVLEVDVSNLNIGDVLHVEDIPVPAGVEILADPKVPVITVAAPTKEEEEVAAEAAPAEAGEVEMIKEKKEGEEEAEEDKGKEE